MGSLGILIPTKSVWAVNILSKILKLAFKIVVKGPGHNFSVRPLNNSFYSSSL